MMAKIAAAIREFFGKVEEPAVPLDAIRAKAAEVQRASKEIERQLGRYHDDPDPLKALVKNIRKANLNGAGR